MSSTMSRCAKLMFFVCFGGASLAAAQGPPPHPGPGRDPILEHLFPPELVMANQGTIELSEAQRSAIIKEMKSAQGQFVELQWKVQEQADKVGQLISSAPVDEAKASAEADKLMDLERQMKRGHLLLLVRIKNALTPEQHEKLKKLRRAMPPPQPPGAPAPPPPPPPR